MMPQLTACPGQGPTQPGSDGSKSAEIMRFIFQSPTKNDLIQDELSELLVRRLDVPKSAVRSH